MNSGGCNNVDPPATLGTAPQNIDVQTIGGLILNLPRRFPNPDPDMPVVE
jgi:hypothetical protein